MEEDWFLRDHRNILSERILRNIRNILIINEDFSSLKIIKSKKQLGNCCFSATRFSDESYSFSWLDCEIKSIKNLIFSIAKIDFFKSDFSLFYFKFFVWVVDDFMRSI